MIALAAPLALLALLALPILVWMHRRRRRAILVDVPSVLFLEAEADEPSAPERVRVDAELLLSLAAAALLALAAAGPRVTSSARGRVVRVVVDNGPAMEARSADGKTAVDRAARAWTGIRDLLRPDDRLDAFPGHGGPDGLLAAARGGAADLRVIVTDRRIVPEPLDVVVVAVGDPAARNVGIVAASVEPIPASESVSANGVVSTRAFVNVVNAGPDAARARLRMFVGRLVGRATVSDRTLDIGAGSAASVVFERPEAAPDHVEFVLDPGDALAADDDATLERRPFRVAFGSGPNGYPDAYRRAVLEGLAAVVGAGLVEDASSSVLPGGQSIDLYVGEIAGAPRGQGTAVLSLRPIEAGREGRRAAMGRVRFDAFSAEDGPIDATGCDLVFASAAPPEGGDGLFETLSDRELSGWRFLPDPLAGTPAPVDHPLWPLFLDALVARARGREVAAGWRLSRGTLDPAVTRIGRDVAPFDPARLAAAVPSRRPKERDLRLLLLAAGTLCLALLWLRPVGVARGRLP